MGCGSCIHGAEGRTCQGTRSGTRKLSDAEDGLRASMNVFPKLLKAERVTGKGHKLDTDDPSGLWSQSLE